MSRWRSAAVGVAASLLFSAALWVVFDWPLFFLAVPFVPFFFWRRGGDRPAASRRCPVCGFRTGDPEVHYCPRDGEELQETKPGG